jgi:hypothetical protein
VAVGFGGVRRKVGSFVRRQRLSGSGRHWGAAVYVVNTRDSVDECEYTEGERAREREHKEMWKGLDDPVIAVVEGRESRNTALP